MSKTNITIPFDEEKLSALDFSLQKENTTAHQAGYMLGVQKVLEILREGFVVDGNQTT